MEIYGFDTEIGIFYGIGYLLHFLTKNSETKDRECR